MPENGNVVMNKELRKWINESKEKIKVSKEKKINLRYLLVNARYAVKKLQRLYV